ncbi:MAG: GNAT family N-acetyltransferase [Firmicutes bacterium]|nr:GNAT family N-acetyltransferase [Bacillota bacterium]
MELFEITSENREMVKEVIAREWGDTVAIRGRVVYPGDMRGFYCNGADGEISGLITFQVQNRQCEIVTLNSFIPGAGIGTQLVRAVQQKAKEECCSRIWLITTNDNTEALRFYQVKGFKIAALYKNSVAELRKLKPSIPETGCYGIPIRDEIEMELPLR